MKKSLLLPALFVALLATSALAAPINFTISDDNNMLTFNGEIYTLVDVSSDFVSGTREEVAKKAYMNKERNMAITVFSHKANSRPYVMVIITKPAESGQKTAPKGMQDFDCDNTWQYFNLSGVKITLPDCARVKEPK